MMSSTTQFAINEFLGICAFKAQPFGVALSRRESSAERAEETAIAGLTNFGTPRFFFRDLRRFVRTIQSV